MTQTPLQSTQDIWRKQPKQRDLSKSNKTGKTKYLHRKYPLWSQNADVDKGKTHQWLSNAGLKAETEGFIMASQDQSLFTRNYQAKIIKNSVDPKCRFCNKYEETVDCLVCGRAIMTPNEYLQRHDRVGQYIHWKICQHYYAPYPKKWYKHKPQKVVETKCNNFLESTYLWRQSNASR